MHYKKKIALITITAILCFMAVGSTASAHEAKTDPSANHKRINQLTLDKNEINHEKLTKAKYKKCQTKEKNIVKAHQKIAARGEKQLAVFDKIFERTKAFYVKKERIASTYETLVSEAESKRDLVVSTVGAVKTNSTTFDCDDENPKANAEMFKLSLKAMNTALKDYKTSIKNLIVAVKSAQADKPVDKPDQPQPSDLEN